MKARVLKAYIDKETRVLRNVDDVVELTKARYDELRKAGCYVVEVKEEANEAKVEAEK